MTREMKTKNDERIPSCYSCCCCGGGGVVIFKQSSQQMTSLPHPFKQCSFFFLNCCTYQGLANLQVHGKVLS